MALTNAYRDLIASLSAGAGGTAFGSSTSWIGVGNSGTAFSPTQTDLVGASKVRKATDAGYPNVSANTITFRATFGTADANFPWEEWGIFNAATGGVMMNRKVESLGTKTSAQTWQFTTTITLTV